MVAKNLFVRTGVDGGAYGTPNALKIVPTPPQRLMPKINRPINVVAVSGQYTGRFKA